MPYRHVAIIVGVRELDSEFICYLIDKRFLIELTFSFQFIEHPLCYLLGCQFGCHIGPSETLPGICTATDPTPFCLKSGLRRERRNRVR